MILLKDPPEYTGRMGWLRSAHVPKVSKISLPFFMDGQGYFYKYLVERVLQFCVLSVKIENGNIKLRQDIASANLLCPDVE